MGSANLGSWPPKVGGGRVVKLKGMVNNKLCLRVIQDQRVQTLRKCVRYNPHVLHFQGLVLAHVCPGL